jgi:hypothetical protein
VVADSVVAGAVVVALFVGSDLSHPLILMRGALSNKRIGFARGGF